jgi:hypothetical protein
MPTDAQPATKKPPEPSRRADEDPSPLVAHCPVDAVLLSRAGAGRRAEAALGTSASTKRSATTRMSFATDRRIWPRQLVEQHQPGRRLRPALGRQRFYANGNVAANVYGQLSELDNTSYGLTAGWDWATVERLSGTVYASYNQGLADYGGFNQAPCSTSEGHPRQRAGLCHGRVRVGVPARRRSALAYSSLTTAATTQLPS